MNNINPLQNPRAEDFSNEEIEENIESVRNSKDQLQFDIQNSGERIAGIISEVKMGLKKQSEVAEILMIWKSPGIVFALVTLVAIVLFLMLWGILNFNNIPPTIPLLYDPIERHFIAVDKSFIFISAISLAIIEGIALRYMFIIANHDRRLAVVMGWILYFLNILILAGIGQLYTIIT